MKYVSNLARLVALLLCVAYSVLAAAKDSIDKKAVLTLDAITYPKIVPNSNHDVIVLICNKNEIGEYGTDSMRTDFFNFALRAQTQDSSADHVIFAQVVVNGAENKKIAENLGVANDLQYPHVFIFPAGSDTAIKYPRDEPLNVPTLARFTAQHSSLRFQLPGTMRKFDEIVANFMSTDAKHQAALLQQAERELEDLVDAGEVETANYYVKIMRRVESDGAEFIAKEIKRLNRLQGDASKVNKARRSMMQYHLNVLHHFKASIPAVPIRDEF